MTPTDGRIRNVLSQRQMRKALLEQRLLLPKLLVYDSCLSRPSPQLTYLQAKAGSAKAGAAKASAAATPATGGVNANARYVSVPSSSYR